MLNVKFSPYGSRVCIIKIVSYEDRNPKGIIQNPNFEQDVPFGNITQLLFSMDALFDEIGNPQRTLAPRGLVKERAETKETDLDGKVLATFRVDVLFRQNASWQGNLVWMENNEEIQFRSVLEMIMIMDGVLNGEKKANVS